MRGSAPRSPSDLHRPVRPERPPGTAAPAGVLGLTTTAPEPRRQRDAGNPSGCH
ncbi:hypothetical protein ACFFX0_28145 [Citricoccus parietis]|uniref:Uncharacterized protein n=1 Tax=Citricoccus parietis TaxID=592307 RepID=A0ABV5G5N6_9MICC